MIQVKIFLVKHDSLWTFQISVIPYLEANGMLIRRFE